jgi:hypothetical protein
MRLSKPSPPTQVVSALTTSLPDFIDPNHPAATALLQNYEAHEVYTVGLDEIQNFSSTTNLNTMATSVGWRFVATGTTGNLGCHVSGSGPKLSGLASTPEIHTVAQRLAQIDDLAARPSGNWRDVPDGDYELRALRIPGLLMEAMWLHCPSNPGQDHIVPIAGIQGPTTWEYELLQPVAVNGPNGFFASLQSAAKARLAEHNKVYGNAAYRIAVHENA